jgi:hypothetical protein
VNLSVSILRQKGVSRGEFEALKRFGDYEELSDGTLMRMEGNKVPHTFFLGYALKCEPDGILPSCSVHFFSLSHKT